jgi:transcriptional regulator with XRE-family HTH domain
MRDTRPTREPTYDQLLEQERLILAATELVHELLEEQGVTKTELAQRLDRTKGFVTQLLGGDRNLTLRTLADLAGALGHRVDLVARPVGRARNEDPEALPDHGRWITVFETKNHPLVAWNRWSERTDCRRHLQNLEHWGRTAKGEGGDPPHIPARVQ